MSLSNKVPQMLALTRLYQLLLHLRSRGCDDSGMLLLFHWLADSERSFSLSCLLPGILHASRMLPCMTKELYSVLGTS